MRDKADDTLAPPAPALIPAGPAPPDNSKFIRRKKPHTLPPLEKFRSLEGRGSPVPQARRRSSIEEQLLQEDGQVAPADGRPVIRLTKCSEDPCGPGGPSGAGLPPRQGGQGVPQLSPMSSRYTPLQPIRRTGGENGTSNSDGGP